MDEKITAIRKALSKNFNSAPVKYVDAEGCHRFNLELPRVTHRVNFSLDVVEGHIDAAKAHAESGIEAGLTVRAISQALVIAMMVSGINTWSQHGHEVVAHAAEFEAGLKKRS